MRLPENILNSLACNQYYVDCPPKKYNRLNNSTKEALMYRLSFCKKLMFSICCLLCLALPVKAAEQLVIGTGLKPPLVSSDTQKGFLDTLAKEIYRRIGIDLEVIILPAKRVLENANSGIEDGCLLRIAGLEKYYPNLIQVPETILNSEFVGYTTEVHAKVTGWESLAPFSVGFVNGWKIFETNVRGVKEIQKVSSPPQLFQLLMKKRVDIILYERWQGLQLARQMQISDIKTLEPPFVTKKMYMYLHKDHADLVPKVAASLADIKADGTYDKLFVRILNPLRTKQ